MTIEVRQLLIRSLVDPQDGPGGGADAAPSPATDAAAPEWLERLKEELMTECKAWLEDQLRRARER